MLHTLSYESWTIKNGHLMINSFLITSTSDEHQTSPIHIVPNQEHKDTFINLFAAVLLLLANWHCSHDYLLINISSSGANVA